MARKIAVFDAHPDPDPARYVHALAEAYAAGAQEAGHEVRTIMLGGLDVPILRTREEWSVANPAPEAVRPGQEAALAGADACLWPGRRLIAPAVLRNVPDKAVPAVGLSFPSVAAPHGPGQY